MLTPTHLNYRYLNYNGDDPSMIDAAPATESRPMSPCITICALGADELCSGCLRTRAEIAGWLGMSAREQWDLLAVLGQRRAARE